MFSVISKLCFCSLFQSIFQPTVIYVFEWCTKKYTLAWDEALLSYLEWVLPGNRAIAVPHPKIRSSIFCRRCCRLIEVACECRYERHRNQIDNDMPAIRAESAAEDINATLVMTTILSSLACLRNSTTSINLQQTSFSEVIEQTVC